MEITSFLLIFFATMKSVIGEKFYDRMIWEMPGLYIIWNKYILNCLSD